MLRKTRTQGRKAQKDRHMKGHEGKRDRKRRTRQPRQRDNKMKGNEVDEGWKEEDTATQTEEGIYT